MTNTIIKSNDLLRGQEIKIDRRWYTVESISPIEERGNSPITLQLIQAGVFGFAILADRSGRTFCSNLFQSGRIGQLAQI